MSNLNFEPGSTVSHFRLEKKLGEGGMGAVYLAEDLTLSRKVAIKFMNRELVAKQAKPEVREALEVRFIREAKSAAAINHPNVCQIYEADFETGDWYIAMEFINGRDLVDILEDSGQFSPSDVADTCRQVASGLKYAWNHYKIVHRDIKPRNIMITDEKMAKIVDLGLAKPITDAEEESEMPDVTMAGTAIGTPQYMAPEQATGDSNIDFMVDIYALGATLYEMCTGEKAFNERTPTMIYMAQMGKKYKPIREFRTDIPDALIQLIDDMLEPERDDRIASYDDILDRIRKMSNTGRSIFDNEEEFSDMTMGVTQIAESIFKDYPEDTILLDRYRVMKKVGASRAGVVYKCIDSIEGSERAVKSLAPGREFSTGDLPLVLENYQRIRECDDPHLVKIYDVQQDEKTGEVFIVMERMEGINLREYTHHLYSESSTLNMRSVIPLLRRVAKVIDHLNDRLGVPHNDIKPESIYIPNDSNDIKLLDYGVTARPLSPASAKPGEYKPPLENTDYMAPEKWEHGAVSKKADQYAFALVVYEMLSRRLPFWVNDPENDPKTSTSSITKLKRARFEKMKKQVLEESIPAVPNIDKNVNHVLLKALSKQPEERFPNCSTFISKLGRAAGVREKSTLLPLFAGAAILVIGALAFLGYLHFQKIEECKSLNQQFVDKRKTVTGRLSAERLAELMESAKSLKQTADSQFEQRELSDAIGTYTEALGALDQAAESISNEEKKLKETIESQFSVLAKNLAEFADQTLAEELFAEEIEALVDRMTETRNAAALDRGAAAWPDLARSLSELKAAYEKSMGDLSIEATKRKETCDALMETLRKDTLIKETPEGQKLGTMLEDEFSKALKIHNAEKNKLKAISSWVALEKTLENGQLKLTGIQKQYKKVASEAQAQFAKAYKALSTRYGNLVPGQFDKTDQYREKAEAQMASGNHHAADKLWMKAVQELDEADAALSARAKELRMERDDIKKGCLTKWTDMLSVKAVDARPFLKAVEPLREQAEAKTAVAELAESLKLWQKVAEALSTADRDHKLAVETYTKNQEAARLKRSKEIQGISSTYPREYDRIKTHPLAKGLLDKVTPPTKLLAGVTRDTDDMDTWKTLTGAEKTLGVAAAELEKRIAAHREKLRKEALSVEKDYTARIEKIQQYPYAGDLVKPAEEHAVRARKAMSAGNYETASSAWKDAQAALTTAEAQLAELKRNETLRNAAMEKHNKETIATLKIEFEQGINKLAGNEFGKTLIARPVSLADKADAMVKTGNINDGLKAWEAANLALKEVEAEVAVREKAKNEEKTALQRQLQQEVFHAKQAYVQRRDELAKSPFAKARLEEPDRMAEQADNASKNNDDLKALALWKKANNLLEDLEVDLKESLRVQAERLRDDLLKQRKTVAQWQKWDPAIGEKLVKYDVSIAMARDMMTQQEFMNAGKQLVKCKAILTEIETFVKDRFVAKPGKDFILAEVGMSFKWVDKLNVWVGKFEVTNAQYRYYKPAHSSRKFKGLDMNKDDQPVCWVSYYDATGYCIWLTNMYTIKKVLPDSYKFRLPTKKEWVTFATCGNPDYTYPWGNQWPPETGNFANVEILSKNWRLKGYSEDFPVTCAVGQSGKNEWDLYGISGNVWEWVADKRDKKFAVFGGSWSSGDKRLLQVDLSNKNYADPQKGYDNIGFRVILEPAEEK